MAGCSSCCGAADFFGERIARRNLRKYRRGGPYGTTNLRLELGDAVDLRDDVRGADVVTLDKVVCWWVRAMVAVGNRVLRLRGSAFRSYVHRNAAIEAALRRAGLAPRSMRRGPFWIVAVFEREVAA